MDYKEKYEQALSRARQFSEHPLQEDSANIVEYIFPELRESEDERIRENIISWLKNIEGQTIPINDYNSAIAWLEKQGETPIGIRSRHATGKLGEIIKGIESADMIEALRTEYEKGKADAISEMQKEWSEEDEAMLKETLALIDTVEDINKAKDGFLGAKMWLKSLKDRVQSNSQWKPSDEQMKALRFMKKAKILDPEERESLNSLYIHLRKLK